MAISAHKISIGSVDAPAFGGLADLLEKYPRRWLKDSQKGSPEGTEDRQKIDQQDRSSALLFILQCTHIDCALK